MKKSIFLVLLILSLFTVTFAEGIDENTEIIDEYAKIYGEKIQDGIDMIESRDMDAAIPKFSAEQLLSDISKGKNIFSIGEIISRLLELLLAEIRNTMRILVFVPAIAMLNTYITGMQSNFQMKGAAQAAFFVCYTVMAGIAATAFFEVVRCGQGVIENISVFMRIMMPISLASLASSGAVISATTFEIVLVSVIEITEVMVEKLFLPMVMAATALNIANNMSQTLSVEKLVQLINKTVKWGLGIMLTLFVGITGIQGIATGTADGLTVKLTKFATSSLIPMVGGILAETVETVMNCSVAIKNSVGILGIIVVIGIAVVPVIKVAACLILFRLCAALIQPISDERCVKCISELGDSVSSVLAMAVAVVVMFVIILTIIINISNSAILLGR
ncbi:MAG: stage III sporulation protein AE [Clostridia bacterium]|nr:stage III sporulation protein AE [Clostridia bacterium]